MLTKKSSKILKKYNCEICHYTTCNVKDYNKHLLTRKHKMLTDVDEKNPKNAMHVCECGKEYKHRQSLYVHRKKCTFEYSQSNPKTEPIVECLLKENLEMKKDNLEMKKMVIDLCKNIGSTNITNNNCNTNNFNINVFLNEQCKDAMNMTDFIESIQLTIEDVEKIGMEGQTQALSHILTNKLNDLDIFKRPVHCGDAKKEIIYVKDEDRWEKEAKANPHLKKALDKITKESLCKLPEFQSDPDEYIKTVAEVLKEPREDKKIISDVAKEILVTS